MGYSTHLRHTYSLYFVSISSRPLLLHMMGLAYFPALLPRHAVISLQ